MSEGKFKNKIRSHNRKYHLEDDEDTPGLELINLVEDAEKEFPKLIISRPYKKTPETETILKIQNWKEKWFGKKEWG